jgi:hypothetical protein
MKWSCSGQSTSTYLLLLTRKNSSVKMKLLAPGQGFPASQFSLERWTEYMVKLILD